MYQSCSTRYHVSFYLWLIGSLLKHCKVPKYYEQDCRSCNCIEIENPAQVIFPNFCELFRNSLLENNRDQLFLVVEWCYGKTF